MTNHNKIMIVINLMLILTILRTVFHNYLQNQAAINCFVFSAKIVAYYFIKLTQCSNNIPVTQPTRKNINAMPTINANLARRNRLRPLSSIILI
jgi:hypothetical protein